MINFTVGNQDQRDEAASPSLADIDAALARIKLLTIQNGVVVAELRALLAKLVADRIAADDRSKHDDTAG